MFSSIAREKVLKTLTPNWKPVLEVEAIHYGFISAFLSAGLHEELTEKTLNRYLLALLKLTFLC